MHISNTVTNDAISTMYDGIRTLSGIRFFSADITVLEQIRTKVVANPMPRPLMAEVVVPNVGHIPNINTKVGFSLISPFRTILSLFILY